MIGRFGSWCRGHLPLVGYLILALGMVVGFYFLNQSRVALCELRHDLDQRIVGQQESVDRGVKFLRQHPHGAFGFTRADIQTQISGQRRALENSRRSRTALNSLACGGSP